jgi:hypothetical protein
MHTMAKTYFKAEQLAPQASATGADANTLPERDLVVSIYPQGYQFYDIEGNRQQLEDEGLIPNDLVWPARNETVSWVRGDVFYELDRRRPADLKGPRNLWINGDWWRLRGFPEKKETGNAIQIRLQRKRLAQLIYEDTPEGRMWESECFRKRHEARCDTSFQSFMAAVLPASKKRKGAERGQAS